MKRTTLLITATAAALVAAAAGNALAQQVYKWKDAKGVTHYSDTPPPAQEQRKVQVKSFSSGGGSVDVPFALAQAMRSNPVVIYTTAGCAACDAARAALAARGVPYTEKTVTTAADNDQLQQAGGTNQLPYIMIGSSRMTGYDSEALSLSLSAAAYPKQRVVGPDFRLASVGPASPPPAAPKPEPVQEAPPVPPAPPVQF